MDALICLEPPQHVTGIVPVLSGQLESSISEPDPEVMIVFNDFDGVEQDPAFTNSVGDGLRVLAANPTLGGLQLPFLEHRLSVFLYGPGEFAVAALSFSLLGNGYSGDRIVRQGFDRLIRHLHRALDAKRTIADFDLMSPDSFWKEEAERVSKFVFAGAYSTDLRAAPDASATGGTD